MGFSPAQVGQMSIWEFNACCFGYSKAHGGDAPKGGNPMSEDRMRDLGLL